jgi:penicillin amidase
MDGSNPDNEWQGFIPQKYNAHTKNPERGFVSSANQHPVDEAYPFYVFNDGYETYRNRVINDFFRGKDKITIQDFKNLQNSNYNLKAAELLPYLVQNMDTSTLTAGEQAVLKEIKAWDYDSGINQTAPAIWETWWSKLYKITWDEFEAKDLALTKPFAYQTIYLFKSHPDDPFMDIAATPQKETAKDLFLITFKETARELAGWKAKKGDYKWGPFKGTFAGHLLQALPAFSRFNIPIGGTGNSVNAASKNHGPSWRMIVEMTSPPRALGIYPGGQSGNPGSRYYDNFIDKWAAGEYINLLFMQNQDATSEIVATQTLIPKR